VPQVPEPFAAWLHAMKRIPRARRKGFDSLAWLVVWSLWRERNHRVHDRRALMPVALAPSVLDEARLWASAGLLCLFCGLVVCCLVCKPQLSSLNEIRAMHVFKNHGKLNKVGWEILVRVDLTDQRTCTPVAGKLVRRSRWCRAAQRAHETRARPRAPPPPSTCPAVSANEPPKTRRVRARVPR
jgi:hypothetical protein